KRNDLVEPLVLIVHPTKGFQILVATDTVTCFFRHPHRDHFCDRLYNEWSYGFLKCGDVVIINILSFECKAEWRDRGHKVLRIECCRSSVCFDHRINEIGGQLGFLSEIIADTTIFLKLNGICKRHASGTRTEATGIDTEQKF